ncbi:hypothetical protein [Bacillus sp. OK048]|uniref:hypothetical protein n=1 Tax=Bacillus sp. OK048 TaxID=1882761 RepID=UPI0008909DAC|nr:hypothetical protein [Bacillus sp. OK048]SDM16826.1 hypothetical protein SAMN05443253_102143 [Bacillus sp. OK048]
MGIKRVPVCLNDEYPEQEELYEFITRLPNGKKRNSSGFLKMLADREYQKEREKYLTEKAEFEKIKKAQSAPRVKVIKANGGIKYLPSQNVN